VLPLLRREIPIVADEMVDPKFGTGAVKVTPAHDAADFQTGKRHDLPEIIVIDEQGLMNENAGDFRGLDRFEARQKVVEALTDAGLDEDTARARAQRAVMMIQGSLVLSRGMGTTKPFRDALAALPNELLGAVG